MADPKEAFDDLNAMIKQLQDHAHTKFKDADMAGMVKLWVKAAVALKGDGLFGPLKLLLLRRGNPGKPYSKNPAVTWTDELYADLIGLRKAMSFDQDNPDPKAFQAASDAMVGFLENYRNQYGKGSKQDQSFEHQLRVVFGNEESELSVVR